MSERDARTAITLAIMCAAGLYLKFLNISPVVRQIMDVFDGNDSGASISMNHSAFAECHV